MPKVYTTRRLTLAAFALLAACTDRVPTESTPPAGQEVRTQIDCTVFVADRTMRCGDPSPAGGGSHDIIMGGQGTGVRLESANVRYDSAAEAFSLDVTVQNLLSLRMGTPDGTTATGVRVFFDQLPTATQGAGAITIANADGEGSYTRIGQPYYAYPGILEPRGASAPRTWRFGVPRAVERFAFTVYVHTQLPAETGVLRWMQEEGPASAPLTDVRGMWGASPRDLFAVGLRGRIMHHDGSRWIVQGSGTSVNLLGVWGRSRSDVYAVGDSGTVLHYDGNRWARLQGDVSERFLKAVWGRGDTMYVAGHQRNASGRLRGLVMRSVDAGESWEEDFTDATFGNRLLWGVAGGEGGRVFVTGAQANSQTGRAEAVILSTADGGETWSDTVFADSTSPQLNRVWAQGQHVFASGSAYNAELARSEGMVMRSADGGATWIRERVPEATQLWSVWGLSPTDVTVVGSVGAILRFDGQGWQSVGTGGTESFQAVWGSSPADLWAGGDDEAFAHDGGAGWTALPGRTHDDQDYVATWGTGPRDLYVVARRYDTRLTLWGSALLHRTAAGWVTEWPWKAKVELADVWGNGEGTVIATGWRYDDSTARYEGIILRNDGAGWTETVSVSGSDRRFESVYGDGQGNVWIAGSATGTASGSARDALVLHSSNDGLSWTETRIPMPGYNPQLLDLWASGPNDIHAVGVAFSFTTTLTYGLRVRYDGTQWTHARTDSASWLKTVWGAGETIVAAGHTGAWYAQDRRGLILTSTDGGVTFGETTVAATVGGDRAFEALWGSSESNLYLAGTGGGILQHDGTGWKETRAGSLAALSGLWGASPTDVYGVGSAGTLLHGVR
jgi:hypothetical protein